MALCRHAVVEASAKPRRERLQKLDIKIGQLVEIAGRRHDVVSDGERGVTLEPAITKTVAEMRAEHGELAVVRDEWVQRFGAPLPPDGEG